MTRAPGVGWYEYRGARFKVEWYGDWFARYYVGDVQLPWQRGSMLALHHEAGWFGRSPHSVIRKVRRTVDREIRRREANGKPTSTDAWAKHLAAEASFLDPLPEPERDYTVLS